MKETYRLHGFITVFFLLFSGYSVIAQQILTLEECLHRVRMAATQTQQITVTRQSADLQKKIIARNYWPQVTMGVKATWQSDVTMLPIDIPNFDIPVVPQEQYAATIDINQLIYDGGVNRALTEIRVAESDLKVNQWESGLLNADKQAIDLYFLLALQEKLKISAELLLGQLEASLSQAEKLLDAGIIDQNDVLPIRIKLVETNQKIEEADSHIRSTRQSLSDLMNISQTDFQIAPEPGQAEFRSSDFSQRPDIQSLESQNRLMTAQNHLNDAKVNPSLGTFINIGYGRPGLNFLANQADLYALAGIKLQVPVEHLFTRRKEMENQVNTLEITQIRLLREGLIRNLKISENRYLEEIDKLKTWLQEDEKIVDLRTQMQSVSRSKWEGGLITTIAYLAEVTELSLAEERKQTHEITLIRAEALLMNLYGLK